MNKGETIRQYELFYETAGNYPVPQELAYEAAHDAVTRISRYTGAIALGDPIGFSLKSQAAVIDTANLTLPRAENHNIFFTGRRIAHPDMGYRQQGSYPRGIFLYGTNDIFVSTSPNLGVPVSREELSSATLHEVAHSFDLGHCYEKHCIMLARLTSRELEIFADIDDPFCGDHAEQLELSGLATSTVNQVANSIVFSNPPEHTETIK